MYRILRALLFLLPAEFAHRIGIRALKLLGCSPALAQRIRVRSTHGSLDLSTSIGSIRFPNPIALAAGFDKDAEAVEGWFALGLGAVEVGTVTPRAQAGNPPPRLFRVAEHQALINRMGFNNRGVEEMARRLARLKWRPAPLGVNLGKNHDTPLDQAIADYVRSAAKLAPFADYLVLNASSPNTPGLRELQEPQHLSRLLKSVRDEVLKVAPRPLFLKIAPDLSNDALDAIVDLALSARIDGLIATNTTVQRPFNHPFAAEPGGLSGAPLRSMATAVIRRAYLRSEGRLPIIGVGGVFTAADAYEKIRAGASAVQVYTALVYQGPSLVSSILRGLARLLEKDGFPSVSAAVGCDHRAGTPADGR
jgi:dihydroorotate dehydrogenase